jgi:hypothetical protein
VSDLYELWKTIWVVLDTYQTEDRLWSYVLEVEHQGDWTYRTKGSSLLIQELFSECYPQLDRLIEFFVATFSRKTDVPRLVRAVRSTREGDRLIAAHDLSNCFMKNCFVFGIVGDFRPSIRRSIYSNEGLAPHLSVAEGVERWHFYSMHDSAEGIVEDLPDDCSARVQRLPPSPPLESGVGNVAHRRRIDLLGTALVKGYFDYPRRVSLTQLARELGMCKSSLSQSMRSALKEVLTQSISLGLEHAY